MALLGKVSDFTKEFVIKIPKYQRGFAWKKENWQEMLEDIIQQPHSKNHYCGPVVYTKIEGDEVVVTGPVSKKISRVNLEDGQQRITTLIFAAWNVMNIINSDKLKYDRLSDFARDLHKEVVFYSKRVGSNLQDYRHPRLTSDNEEYNDFLGKVFAGHNPSAVNASTRRLLEVIHSQRDYFSKLSVDDLEIKATRVLEGLLFVFINLGEQNIDPQVAFHTINSRGVPLREFDKVKNGLMSTVATIGHQNSFDEIEREWYKTIVLLDNHELQHDEDSFLSLAFGIRMDRNSIPSRSNLSEEILSCIASMNNCTTKLNCVEKILESWRYFREAFVFVYAKEKHEHYKTDSSPASQVNNTYIDSLRRLESMKLEGIVQPLLMVAHKKLINAQLSKRAELAVLLEKFVFRVFAVARNRIDHLRSELHILTRDFYHDRINVDDVMRHLVFWTIKYCPLTRALEDLFDSDRLRYDRWEINRLGYFLLEYEHYLKNGSHPMPHPIIWKKKEHSVEHVCPQQQSGSYSVHLRYNDLHADWKVAFPNANHWRINLHRIGNLVITEHNSPLGNKSWSDKSVLFAGYSFAERQLAGFVRNSAGWGEESISLRECALAKFVVERWNVGLDTEKVVGLPLNLQNYCQCTTVVSDHTVHFNEEQVVNSFSDNASSSLED